MELLSLDQQTPAMMPAMDLASFNTLGVSARAAYFCRVDCLAALNGALAWRKEQQALHTEPLPIMALGGGSNIVLAADFPGLVVSVDIGGRELIEEDDDYVWLRVGAGESWHQLVEYCMGFHYWGLENLALIPGSVGAAPIQNIGAYGVELCDYFAELTAVEIASGISVTFDRDACHFGYRDSIFKGKMLDRYIITSVTFKLRKTPAVVCDYPGLEQYFSDIGVSSPSPQQIFDAVCEIRSSKLPAPVEIPNVGSFFKNPVVGQAQYESLQARYPGLVGFALDSGQVKLAAGWLIDQAGWRGKRVGPVGIHDRQALVLVNTDGGTGADVLGLAELIRRDIFDRYGVQLEIEPRVYP